MNERGIALVITLFVLVLLSELAIVGFITGLDEIRAGRNSVSMEHALESAEGGVNQMLQEALGDSSYAGTALTQGALDPPLGSYRGSIRKLGDSLFLLRSEGFSRDGQARAEVAIIARAKRSLTGSFTLERVAERSFILVY